MDNSNKDGTIIIKKNTHLSNVLKLTHPCKCEACSHGCKFGSGFLVGKDKERMARLLGLTEKELEEIYLEEVEQFNTKLFRPKIKNEGKPYGKCIFFDEKIGCKVHEAKPLQCRIAMGCKDYGEELMVWFMMNYQVKQDDEKSMREYDIYLKSGGKTLK